MLGSPLSAVLANLFMEVLEVDYFRPIVGNECFWVRYVDDCFVMLSQHVDLDALVNTLNNVNPHIQFTTEMERNGKLPFLNILLDRTDD